jgi:hypothetical protein
MGSPPLRAEPGPVGSLAFGAPGCPGLGGGAAVVAHPDHRTVMRSDDTARRLPLLLGVELVYGFADLLRARSRRRVCRASVPAPVDPNGDARMMLVLHLGRDDRYTLAKSEFGPLGHARPAVLAGQHICHDRVPRTAAVIVVRHRACG